MTPFAPSQEDIDRYEKLYQGTDKFMLYLDLEYFEYFGIDKNVKNVLEIGSAGGASAKFLAGEVFPNADVVSIDINPPNNDPDNPRVSFLRVNQEDSESLKRLAAAIPFDVVIDDASHIGSLTRNCFDNIWPFLLSGAVYVIEDWRADVLNRHDMQDIIEDLTNNQEKYGIASVKNVLKGEPYGQHTVEINITPEELEKDALLKSEVLAAIQRVASEKYFKDPVRAISFFKKA